MARVDDLAGALAVRMLAEAGVPVSEASLALVELEAAALAGSVVLMEERIRQARRRIAELAAVAGADKPRVVDFDPSRHGPVLAGAAWSPGSN